MLTNVPHLILQTASSLKEKKQRDSEVRQVAKIQKTKIYWQKLRWHLHKCVFLEKRINVATVTPDLYITTPENGDFWKRCRPF